MTRPTTGPGAIPTALGVLAAYLGILLGFSFPLVLDLDQVLLGLPTADQWNHVWDLWWAQKGLLGDGASFLYSDYIYWPPGANLWGANSGPLLYLFALLLHALGFGPFALYNLVFLFCFLGSCAGGYAMAAALISDRRIAFLVGLLVAYNPLTLFWMQTGLYEVVNLGFGLLFFGSLIRLFRERTVRAALVSLLWFYATAGWGWYVGYVMLLLAILYGLFALDLRELFTRRRHDLRVFVPWGLLLLVPLLVVANRASLGAVEESIQAAETRLASAMDGRTLRLAREQPGTLPRLGRSLGLPEPGHLASLEIKLIASVDPYRLLTDLDANDPMAPVHPLRWLVPLLLAALGLVLGRGLPLARFCGLACAFSALIALGPCLVIKDQVFFSSFGLTPFSLLGRVVPGLDRMQFPQRIFIMAIVAGAVLGGLGLKLLFARCRWRPWQEGTVLAGLAVLSLASGLDIGGAPMVRATFSVPAYYLELGKNREDFAIIDVPFTPGDGIVRPDTHCRNAVYQTVHGKRRLQGQIPKYLARAVHPPEIEQHPLLVHLANIVQRRPAPSEDARLLARLRASLPTLARHRFRALVLHPQDLQAPIARRIRTLLVRLLGEPHPDASDPSDLLEVFALPPPS